MKDVNKLIEQVSNAPVRSTFSACGRGQKVCLELLEKLFNQPP